MFNSSNSPIIEALLKNCTSFEERRKVFSLTESESRGIHNDMITRLFNSAIEKSHIDFGDIPESKGDVTKYKGYKSMVDSLNTLRTISLKASHKIGDIEIVERALSNVVAHRDNFERGFSLNKDYIVLQYNTVVSSCVMATSALISSYVEFIKNENKITFNIINPKTNPGSICIENLNKFNKSVSSGEFTKVINTILNSDRNAFIGAGAAIPIIIIAGAVVGVIFIRDIVFYIYYSRVKLAQYLRVQALFLQLNENVVNSDSYNASASKKEKVLKKQAELIKELNNLANAIDVSDKIATQNSKNEIKKDTSGWKIDDVKAKQNISDSNGYQLI